MTDRYYMRKERAEWEEVDEETFFRYLFGQIMIRPDYDIVKALKRFPVVGTRHMFKIVEERDDS